MSAKFTKGPWGVDGNNVKAGRYSVAIAYDPNDSLHQNETSMANACLMAAAPDAHAVLREELEALIIWIDAIDNNDISSIKSDVREGMCISISKIETVLFKMEGK